MTAASVMTQMWLKERRKCGWRKSKIRQRDCEGQSHKLLKLSLVWANAFSSVISASRGHSAPENSFTGGGGAALCSHITSHVIIFHLCWLMFKFTACILDLKWQLNHAGLCVTDETTSGRGSLHTWMFTFPVSLFPQRQWRPDCVGQRDCSCRAVFSPQHLPLGWWWGCWTNSCIHTHPAAFLPSNSHIHTQTTNLCFNKSQYIESTFLKWEWMQGGRIESKS